MATPACQWATAVTLCVDAAFVHGKLVHFACLVVLSPSGSRQHEHVHRAARSLGTAVGQP
eukprot:8586234-Pyramimonas_sp.AAC.1